MIQRCKRFFIFDLPYIAEHLHRLRTRTCRKMFMLNSDGTGSGKLLIQCKLFQPMTGCAGCGLKQSAAKSMR